MKTVLGIVLFLWMVYSIYHQIMRQPNLTQTLHSILNVWTLNKILWVGFVFLLMVANWLVESMKWQKLLHATEKFSIWTSLQSVLTGVAVSIITPNRIGEYMGRVLYLRNKNKLQGITVTIIGSFAQLMVTGFLGLIGLLYYIAFIKSTLWLYVLLAASVMLSVGLGLVYFNLNWVVQWTTNFVFLKKIKTYLEIIKRFNRKKLIEILLLSLLRYMIYTIQFFVLLKLLLVTGNSIDIFFTILLIFWAMAIVPTISIAEVGIRGQTAIYFLLPLCANQLGIASATMLLWLINLIIPSLIGCLFLYKMKIYEDE